VGAVAVAEVEAGVAQAGAEALAGAVAEAVAVAECDLRAAMRRVGASALRAYTLTRRPETTWADVGGYEDAKRALRQAVEWPLRHADACRRLGVRPSRGVLLHGPPGCSKTTLVRAAANASGASFFALSGADVYSSFVGDTEAKVREVFRLARAAAPAIVFLDELDAMVGRRDLGDGGDGAGGDSVSARVLSTLLNELDGVEEARGVLLVGATNRPDAIDAALLRPGRLDRTVEVGLPDAEALEAILRIHTRGMTLEGDVSMDELVTAAKGLSGAEVEAACREAALKTLRGSIDAVAVPRATLAACLRRAKRQSVGLGL